MMLTPNGFLVRARTAAISALSFWSVPPNVGSTPRPPGFAYGGHQLDAAAALHGALQDRIADAQQIADDGVKHEWRSAGGHFALVPAMRLSEPAMNSCTPTSVKPAARK